MISNFLIFASPERIRRIGLGRLLTWAGFWVWFNLASAFGEGGGSGWAGVEVGHLLMAAVVATASLAAWRRPLARCPALLALSAYGWRLFPATPFLVLSLLTPPTAAALLLLAAAVGQRSSGGALARPARDPGWAWAWAWAWYA